jgi:hypothetical protein
MANGGREVFVGIDVGKNRLDVYIRPLGQHVVVDNDEAGAGRAGDQLEARPPRLIVLEASGGYERLAAIRLLRARLAGGGQSARPGSSPRRSGSWPRPIRSMRRCWRILPKPSGRRRGRSRRAMIGWKLLADGASWW